MEQAKCLQQTGGGVDNPNADAECKGGGNIHLDFYIPADGPNDQTEA